MCTVKRIPNIYSQNPNSATSLPNTQFIFPKQIFIILCGPSLPMRPKARVLALINVMPKLISAVYQQLGCQMHTAEQLLLMRTKREKSSTNLRKPTSYLHEHHDKS
jgi:hypothetical protein